MYPAFRFVFSVLVLAAALCFIGAPLLAQPATQPDAPIALEFPVEGIELKTLVEIVMKRLHTPILYDDTILNKHVIVRVPVNVPESALLGVLQSALRMKQMALVDSDLPGWKQVVQAPNLAAVAKPLAAAEKGEAGVAVTQVITLKHADPARLIEALRPLLTTPGGNVQALTGQKTLIVSDYPVVIKRLNEMIALLDTEGAPVDVQFVPLKQAEAAAVAPIATALVTARDQYQFGGPAGGVLITPDERINQVIVVGPADRMKDVLTLIKGLDQTVDLQTKVYRLKSLSPERLDKLVKNLLGPGAIKRSYQSTADRESQSLVVSATPEVHARIEAMTKELDVSATDAQSPIRFYKLKTTKAAEVLATIGALYSQNGGGVGGGLEFDSSNGEGRPANGSSATPTSMRPVGAGTFTLAAPGNLNPTAGVTAPSGLSSLQRPAGDTTRFGNGADAASRYGYNNSRAQSGDLLNEGGNSLSVRAANATVAADPNTNSIIVIAPPAVQISYAELIKRLDERRPQVQIECTIVTLDTSDGANFAIDVGKLGGAAASKVLTFNSFGVSTIDIKTGGLTPGVSTGGTTALLSPGIADVVIHALSTHSRARLVSAPQILVNDNGKGKLQSVNQQPFAEILDTASTQSRTGLGGQAEAGTTISVEPHISQDDYLQLSYSVELSSFTGSATAGLPPPSQKNTIDSQVTIPDGYTIVVGGLNQKNFTAVLNSLPLIDQIPIINLLFGGRSVQHTDTTLFVFIRPVILRDDKFDDLKYLSELKTRKAGLPGEYPKSEPIPIK
jgi:type II secretory pathway component GspD/PulD (secretin)